MRVFLVGSLLFVTASCVGGAPRVAPASTTTDRPDAQVEQIAVAPQPGTTSAPDDRSPFSVGDRVTCNWKSGGTFYDGKVVELRDNGRIFVQYDDGDQEETSPSLCGMTGGGGPGIDGAYRVGDRVSCNWRSGGRYYDGRVGELRGSGRLFVQYDDGDTEETSPALCRSLGGPSSPSPSLRVGDRVSCNWLGKGAFYEGVLAELRPRGRIFVHYDDGDTEETSFQMCRAANGTTTTLPGKKFRAGERVSCNWKGGGTFYEGRVQNVRAGNGLFIQYDDGDTEETTSSLCRSLGKAGKPAGPLRAGDRVACNWLGQGTFYSGRVAEMRAHGKLFIQYDDGDQEETKPNLCRRL